MPQPKITLTMDESSGKVQLLADGRALALPAEGEELLGALRRLLRAQRHRPVVGAEGPATYSFMLHLQRHAKSPNEHCKYCNSEKEQLEGAQVTKVPMGLRAGPRAPDVTADELGL